jgi:hypothetical protein
VRKVSHKGYLPSQALRESQLSASPMKELEGEEGEGEDEVFGSNHPSPSGKSPTRSASGGGGEVDEEVSSV